MFSRNINFVSTYKGMFTCVIGNGLNGQGASAGAGVNDPIAASNYTVQLYVGVQPNDIAPGLELSPRIALTPVPYANVAQIANSVSATNITGNLPGAQVGSGVLAANITGLGSLTTLSTITTSEITDGTIGTVDLANASVTGAKLANTAVTAGIYGSATQVSQITVDAQGRLTSASNVAISATGTVTSVSGTAPVSVATGTTTPSISITQATNSTNGYLSSTDWNTFNSKLGTASALGGDLTGTHSAATVAKIQGQAVSSSTPTANQVLQYVGSTWTPTTIPAGTVTSVSGVGPVSVATGTTTPSVSISQSNTSTNGYLSSTDWNTFNNKQAVFTADNGLTFAANDVKLGGTLTANTTIASATFNLLFTGTGKVGIGTPTPLSKLDVGGTLGLAVGNTYAGAFAAPANGALIQGNVVIGNALTAPVYSAVPKLHVYNLSGSAGLTETLRVTAGGTTIGDGPVINFQSAYGGATPATYPEWINASIGSPYTGSFQGDLTFYTNNGSVPSGPIATSALEKMRITSSGKVGIGTPTPVNILDVEAGAAIGAGYAGTSIAPTNGLIVQGNVGIGTASPSFAVDVSSAGQTTVNIGSTAATDVWTYYAQSGSFVGAMGFRSGGNLTLFNAGDDLVIDPTGKVGIGTTTPSYLLHVNAGAGVTAMGVNCGNASDGIFIGNSTTSGGVGLRSYVTTTATAAGTRYGVYSTAWYGQGVNFGTYSYGYGGTTAYGIYAIGAGGSVSNYAGYFSGNVYVGGTLSKAAGSFKIDHPQDPEGKYLSHSFVESPDMLNIYNGNVVTDAGGMATVSLPTYFEALNKDFRYQLTVIKDFAQAIVYEEVSNNSFVIKTDKPNIKVSWQVTGVRHDAWAEKNRIPNEEDKKGAERGKYLNPSAFDMPAEMGIHYQKPDRDQPQPSGPSGN